MINTATNEIVGFNYVTITLMLVDNSLYAVISDSYIEVDNDKMLYLDGRNSYDARDPSNTNYTFTWTALSRTSAVLPNTNRIAIYPENRISWYSNTVGNYFRYSLVV